MGTTAEKGQRVLQSIAEVQQGINNLGGSLTDQTPFKNFKSELDNIYNNLPKTDYEEGSNITLENCLKGKLDFEDGIVGYGDTKQTQYEGYNLCEAKMPTTTASQGIKFTNNGDGTYTVSGTNSSENSVTFRINQSTQIGGDNLQNYEDGTYTLDLGIADANMGISLMQNVSWTTYLGTSYGTRLVSRAITNATNTFIYVAVKANASFSTPVTIKPMFVKGSYTESTIPSFEPYVGGTASPNPSYPQDIEVVRGTQTVYIKDENNNIIDTKTINLGEYEFAKIGNYVDTIEYDVDEDKVYKNEKIGKVVLNGTETWTKSSATACDRFLNTISDLITNNSVQGLLSNYFKTGVYSTSDLYSVWHNATYLAINYTEYGTTTLADFKTWLSTHNTEVYYPLAETTKTEITGTLKDQIKALYNAHSNNGTTIITSNGNLPMIIKCRALKGE